MKRGKDDDKNMGPMFPRLHVNDTEKGGPRAPPRNKMALYEQLTIPSHRYNSGAVPLNHSNNSNLVPSTSTNQGMGRERNMYFPLYRSSPAPSYDERQARNTEAVSSSGQAEQVDSRKKPPEEDDFMVPIFSEAGKGPSDNKIQSTIESERQKHLSAIRHVMPLSYGDEEANQSGGRDHAPIQRVINKDGRSSVAFDASTRYPDTLMREKNGGRWRDDASVQEEHAETHRLSTLEKTDACFRQDLEDSVPALDTRYGRDASDQVFRSTHRNVSLSLKHNPQMEFGYRDGNEVNNAPQRIVDGRSLERENVERGDDDVSETSMVDCASGLDVSPDDVVGILGQKHFWKARTAIVNQQRVFAVQVFELHRLIKVQKLIAGSPHLLLEESAIVEKAALNRSALKQYSSDYAVKALSHNIKQKDDSQKQTDKLEGTAENAVTKVPIPPPQNAIQPAGYQSFPVGPAPSPPVNTDPKMNPWSFHQPTGQQWLVPVMSPSEGLVYKPYPASSFMSPICGGCGPTPMPVNLMNSPYGAPTPPYHQGMGMPFGGQGYFFPYGMPMMSPAGSASAVDQTNPFSGPNPHGQMGQPGGGSIVQHQSSCNMPNQKNGTTPPPALRAPPPKEGELQGSTASSSSERAQVPGMAPPPREGRDALPLFPTAPVAEISEATPPTEDRSRVIKVVPHNPGSTRESAARIFQSIQEERQRHELI